MKGSHHPEQTFQHIKIMNNLQIALIHKQQQQKIKKIKNSNSGPCS